MNDLDRAIASAKPVEDVPALGISIQASAGDRRQIVLQTFLKREDDEATINSLLDRLQRVIDRQQAGYDLDAELEGFHKVGGTLRLNIDGLPIAARNAAKELATLQVRLQELQTMRESAYQEGYADWAKRGGRGGKGAYEPKGHTKNRIATLDAEIEKARAAVAAKPADETQHRQEVMKTIAHFQDDLKKRRARINHLHALLGKDPIREYEDVEAFKAD